MTYNAYLVLICGIVMRIRDQALVLGIADHDLASSRAEPSHLRSCQSPGITFGLQVIGCKVNAIVERGDSTELARLNAHLESYPLHGKIDLHSYDSGESGRMSR